MDDSADSAASRFRPARGRAWASVVVGAAFVLTQDVDAAALNLNRYLTPLSTRAGPALISDDAHDRAMQCLTQAIYYEAASEPITALNRNSTPR